MALIGRVMWTPSLALVQRLDLVTVARAKSVLLTTAGRESAVCCRGELGLPRIWPECASYGTGAFGWLRGLDLNQRPPGYEPERSILSLADSVALTLVTGLKILYSRAILCRSFAQVFKKCLGLSAENWNGPFLFTLCLV